MPDEKCFCFGDRAGAIRFGAVSQQIDSSRPPKRQRGLRYRS